MSQQALATAAGLSSFRVRTAVEQLTQLMLLDIQQEQIISIQTYGVHPLTRAFVQTQLGSSPEYEQEARVCWSGYYVKFARQHLVRGKQNDRYWNTLVRSGGAMEIDREWFNLLNVLEWADHTKQHQVLIELVLLLSHYMNRHFHYNERLYYSRKAALAAEILNDLECAALFRIDTLGWTLIETKRLEEAEQEITAGLSIAQALHPVSPRTVDLLALAHILLARVFLEQGLLKKAEVSIDHAATLDSSPVIQFRAAMIAGDIAYKKKELQKAIQLYNQAHRISLQYGQEGEDEDLAYHLGMAYLATKDPIQAEQSFKNLPNLPERYSGVTTGVIYIKLGEAYVARINNNYEEARRLVQEALSYLSLVSNASHWMHDEIQRFLEEGRE